MAASVPSSTSWRRDALRALRAVRVADALPDDAVRRAAVRDSCIQLVVGRAWPLEPPLVRRHSAVADAGAQALADDPAVRPPLRVTLHQPTVAAARGADLVMAMLLRDLASHSLIDLSTAWSDEWSWGPQGRVRVLGVDPRADTSARRDPAWWAVDPSGVRRGRFAGWDHACERIARLELGAKSRTYLLDAYKAVFAHIALEGHLFATWNKHLLRERDDPYWDGVRIVTPTEAVGLVGCMLRWHERDPGDEQHSVLSAHLRAVQEPAATANPLSHETELVQQKRMLHLHYARDEVARHLWGTREFDSVIPMEHAMAGFFVAAAGLVEAWAVAADRLLDLKLASERHTPTLAEVTRALEASGKAPDVLKAIRDGTGLPLVRALGGFRHVVAHAQAFSSSIRVILSGPRRVRFMLSAGQASALRDLARARGLRDTAQFGLLPGEEPACDPWRLTDRLLRITFEEVVQLNAALSEHAPYAVSLTRPAPDDLNWDLVLDRVAYSGLVPSPLLTGLDGMSHDLGAKII